MITAQYEESGVETGYFTSTYRGNAASYDSVKSFALGEGKRYRITIDDLHLCLNADPKSGATVVNDGIYMLITNRPNSGTTSVRWKDTESNIDITDTGTFFISLHTHGGGLENACWPKSQGYSTTYGEHMCTVYEHSAYIGSAEGTDVGGAKFVFETDRVIDMSYIWADVRIIGTYENEANSAIMFNARYTVEEIN